MATTLAKDDLIKTDPKLRQYQLDALLKIFPCVKCLVKMFCGTGKSRIITNVIIHEKKKLSVAVFPSLALIIQYSRDYLNHEEYKKHFKKHETINISSEMLADVESTTDPKEIKTFLKKKGSKIILVTYQSYQVLLDNLDGNKIGLVCYDEAHHVVSPECQKLVFFRPELFEKEVFFTATPKNENGITMYDRDGDADKNMCGELAYEYTYLQGLNDKDEKGEPILNAFQICIDMFTEDANVSLYEAMARAILKRGTSRVLSFHSGVNGESNTNVWNFVNPEKFKEAFDKVQQSEFPEKKGYYKKITFKGMDGKTPSEEREILLNELDNTPDNEIYIISSCETIGEGVDTKKANMCVFADPKSSITKIIQNIGRVVRPNPASPLSTILIPCFVDMEHYAAAQDDRVKTDELIREQMRATNGDYAPILNVLAALKQEDPELYDMCLNYPNKEHKEQSLNEQGYRIVEEDDDDYDGETYTSEEVEELKEDGETPLEIHTNETIERFNMDSDCEPLKRLYRDEEVYKPIVKMDDAESETDEDKDDLQEIQPPKQKRVGMSIHHNSDIEILWSVKEELDFNNKFCSVVIDCEVSFSVEKWKKNLEGVKKYIDENEKRLSHSNTNKDVKIMAAWISTQRYNYDIDISKCKQILKQNHDIYYMWTKTINDEKYKKYLGFDVNEEWLNEWKSKLQRVIKYIDDNKKCPSAADKNPTIKSLGTWLVGQRMHYDENISKSTNTMKHIKIHSIWSELINDSSYRKYLVLNPLDSWKNTLNDVKEYIDNNKKLPSSDDDYYNKYMGRWITHQKTNYDVNVDKCYGLMRDKQIRDLWTATLNDSKYVEFICNGEEFWKIMLNRVKKYMDDHEKRPSDHSTDGDVRFMGNWISSQKSKYDINRDNCNGVMNCKEIHTLWTQIINDVTYTKYLITDRLENWKKTLEQVKNYIDINNARPGTHDENREIRYLGGWISRNKKLYLTDILKCKENMKEIEIHALWTATINDPKYRQYLEIDLIENWKKNLELLKKYIIDNKKNPSNKDVDEEIRYLSHWWTDQKQHYKKRRALMKNKKIYDLWTEFINEPKPKPTKEKKQTPPPPPQTTPKKKLRIIQPKKDKSSTSTTHTFPPPSAIGELHKTYRRMRSDTLHEKFKADPKLWLDYHATREANLASYDPASIPCNVIIQKLEKIQTKRPKVVVDMGCGKAPIAHYFRKKNDKRFVFHNYDHQSGGDLMITEANIIKLPLEDISVEIVIMSLVLSWGTQEDRLQYVKEAERVLESGGKFYVIDTTKTWSPEPITPENGGELLRTFLTTNGFKIINEDIGLQFCFFECVKQ